MSVSLQVSENKTLTNNNDSILDPNLNISCNIQTIKVNVSMHFLSCSVTVYAVQCSKLKLYNLVIIKVNEIKDEEIDRASSTQGS
jgi:hypothetical protein